MREKGFLAFIRNGTAVTRVCALRALAVILVALAAQPVLAQGSWPSFRPRPPEVPAVF